MTRPISRLRRTVLAAGCALSALMIPAAAHADPITAAIVAVVNVIGGATIAATVGNFLIAYGGTLYATAASMALTKLSKTKGATAAQERQASVTTLNVGEVAREVVFGRACTAGSLTNAFNYGGTYGTDWECQVRAIADHEIDALEGFYVADTYYAFSGNGLQAAFSNKLDIEFVNGGPGAPAPPARFATAAGLSSTDRLHGVAHVYFSYKADEAVWPQGRPTVKFVVRGKRCYDGRKDSTVPGGSGSHRWSVPTTWEWTENAQVCRYNWVRGIYALDQVGNPQQLLIGRGLSATEAPPERIFAAANVCDEAVPLLAGGTEPRYRVGGVIRADETFDTVEQYFAAAMAGVIVQREGGVEIEPGQGKSTVAEITDLDLVTGEKVTFDRFLSDTQRINSVIATYIEPTQNWGAHAAPIRRSITDIVNDGGPREDPLALDLVSSGTQAQRCAEIQRRQSRRERRATIVLGPRFSRLEEGDWIGWTSDRRHGGERVVYRLEAYSRAPTWRKTFALREVSAADYSWSAATDEYVPGTAPPPEPGAPGALVLEGVTITPVNLLSESGGTSVPAVQAIWDAPVDPAVFAVRLEVRQSGEAEVAATVAADVNSGVMLTTNGVAAGAVLEARLVPIGDGGREKTPSDWIEFTAGSFAFDTIGTTDGLLTVYYQNDAPTAPERGDVWFDTNAGNAPFQWDGTGWVDASDNAAVQAIQFATAAQATANTKILTFYQTSAPTALAVGDLWVDTDDATRRVYRWNGSSWLVIADQTGFNIAAGFTGQGALATLSVVDWATKVTGVGKPEDYANKVIVYKQTSAPTGATNDVWIRTDGSGNGLDLWVYNGSSWISGADRTPYNIAMGITGQGPWATASVPSGLTPTVINGRTQYLDTSGQVYSYRGLYWGYSVGVAAGRNASPLSSDVGSAACAAHTIYLYRQGYSTGYPISVSSHTASGLADDTAYTWFYRPDYGDHFCVYAGYAPAYVASQDGYMLVGDIKTPASSGYYVPPGATSPDPGTAFDGNYDSFRCVAVSAFLASGQVAGDARVGDALILMSPAGDRVLSGAVEAIVIGDAECLTFTTLQGAVLTVSASTPIMTRKAAGFMPRAVRASEASVGLPVPILTEDGDLVWDDVTSITPAGRQPVAHISARGIGVFAASDHPTGPRLFTHNMWNKVPE